MEIDKKKQAYFDWIVAMFFLTCRDRELNKPWFMWLLGYEMAVQIVMAEFERGV